MEHWHQLSLKIGRKGSNQKGAGHWGQTARWRRKNGCHHRGTEDTEKTPHKNPFYAAFSLCPLCLCGHPFSLLLDFSDELENRAGNGFVDASDRKHFGHVAFALEPHHGG